MEEQKIENFTGEAQPVPTGEAMAEEAPAQMPTPAPMPTAPVEPQQPVSYAPPVIPEVERMQMPMQPIDLSTQSDMAVQQGGMTMQMETPTGGNKKMMIIIGVVVAGLVVGGIAFFVWKGMQQPAPETPVVEQTPAPVVFPPVTAPIETAVVPPAPQMDAITVIEKDLNAFNVGGIDAEVQGSLSEISKSL